MNKTTSPYYTRGRTLIIENDILNMDKISRLSISGDDTIVIYMEHGNSISVKPFKGIGLLLGNKDTLIDYMSKLTKDVWPDIVEEKQDKKEKKEKKEKNPLEGRVKALETENKKLQETLDILEARLDSLQASKVAPPQVQENLLDI